MQQIKPATYNPESVAALKKELLDDRDRPLLMRAEDLRHFVSTFGRINFIKFCYQEAIYQYPTVELVTWLEEQIAPYGKDKVIEIGSGNNCLAYYLGIQGTDNYCQQKHWVKQHYASLGQETTCNKPPSETKVENIDALSALKKFKPKLVIGSWVTPLWNEQLQSGNQYGVDYQKLIANCDRYILIGNKRVHGDLIHPFAPFEIKLVKGLISRSQEPNLDCVFEWRR